MPQQYQLGCMFIDAAASIYRCGHLFIDAGASMYRCGHLFRDAGASIYRCVGIRRRTNTFGLAHSNILVVRPTLLLRRAKSIGHTTNTFAQGRCWVPCFAADPQKTNIEYGHVSREREREREREKKCALSLSLSISANMHTGAKRLKHPPSIPPTPGVGEGIPLFRSFGVRRGHPGASVGMFGRKS